jgi:hypothetical protein
MVQEVFLAIYEHREGLDPSVPSTRAWVLQFGYYKSLKRRRYLFKRQFYDKHVCTDEGDNNPLLVQHSF